MNESVQRAYSQAYKNFKLLFKQGFRLFDVTLWPLLLFFSLSFFLVFLNATPQMISLVVLGILGWRAVYHAQFEIAVNYMEEYWSNSLTHLFATPIRLVELIMGGIISSIFKLLVVWIILLAVAVSFYGFAMPDWGVFLIASFFLFLFGASLGMITLGLLLRYGEPVFSLAYTVPDIFVLFSGVYYPISVLPLFLQQVAFWIPSTHAFGLFKELFGIETVNWSALIGMTVLWLVGSYLFLRHSFSQTKKSGKLVRVA